MTHTKRPPKNSLDWWSKGPKLSDEELKVFERRPTVVGIEHVEITVPKGGEEDCRHFYVGVLGLETVPQSESPAEHCFLRVRIGDQQVHFRTDVEFRPARFAHACLLVSGAERLADRLTQEGYEVTRDQEAALGRFHTRDPFGNRIEIAESGW